jgi:hypothetical protein
MEYLVATRKEHAVQPDSNEQSGSTGRRTAEKDLAKDKDTGQDHYGQSGAGGSKGSSETAGQRNYRKTRSGSEQSKPPASNPGSGTGPDESEKGPAKP